jgi:hypothetical protein
MDQVVEGLAEADDDDQENEDDERFQESFSPVVGEPRRGAGRGVNGEKL